MRRVWIVAFPGAQVLDVTGPWEVFALANRAGGTRAPRYAVSVVAPSAGAIATSGGLALVAQRTLAQATGPVDTVIVAGGEGTRPHLRAARLVRWITGAPLPRRARRA
jgi:transcriptional regulator GlxA family with amidase domain